MHLRVHAVAQSLTISATWRWLKLTFLTRVAVAVPKLLEFRIWSALPPINVAPDHLRALTLKSQQWPNSTIDLSLYQNMTTLKRSASFAFGLEDVATLVDRVQVTQSAPPSPRKRSASQSSRSPSFRRAAIPRSAIQHRQPSLRRVAGEVLSATTYRAIKRQRTNPPEEWNDGWQVVTLPLETGEIVQKMVMVSKPVPQPPSPTPVQNGIVAATYRLFSTLGICRSSTPATSSAGLPHLIQPPIQVPSQDFSLNHHQVSHKCTY